jgi:hypothetical protein
MFILTPYLGVEPVDEVVPRPLPQPVKDVDMKVPHNISVSSGRRTIISDMYDLSITFFQILSKYNDFIIKPAAVLDFFNFLIDFLTNIIIMLIKTTKKRTRKC